MNITEILKQRRSYYMLNKALPVAENEVVSLIEQITELVPDAFNMKSSRVVVALGEKQNELWDMIFDTFGGKVPREKIDSFKAGAGTVLYFYDEATVQGLQKKFPLYADNFPLWALQASGMLQINIWSGLREMGIGASLQHYNPVIDAEVHEMFNLPATYRLIAQMPFGGISAEPPEKPKEDISQRVVVAK